MKEPTRRTVIAGGLSALVAPSARAQSDWPDRPVTMIHGFPAGGTVDLVARIVADGLSRRISQPVVVEGRTGASGAVAAGHVARAAPNGNTLLAIPSGHIVVAATFKSLPYRAIEDFTAIGTTTEYPYVMVTHAGHPARSIGELLALARTRDTPLLYGTPGNGSGPHMAIELLARQANVRLQHVPYRGSAPAVTDLIGQRLDFMMDPPGPLLEFVRDGRLRALAVTGEARFFSLPDVPTVSEAALPGYTVTAWQALLGPAGLPDAIVNRLNAELGRVLREPAIAERLRAIGNEAKPSTPEELRARMAADLAKWNSVVESTNFQRI
jgi:tripartite-type tricarboxylate transporter receptor subunit TctC